MSLTILVLYGIPHESRADFSIGVIAPLTGPRSDGGTYIKQAAEIAEEDLARSSGGMIRFILEDSGYEPAKAVTAFKKLVEIDGVSLIVGPYGSSEVLAVAPLAERAKKIIIAPGAQSDEISTAGDYVFRTIHNSAQEGPFFAPHVAKRMNGVELAVLAIQTAFSPSYLKHFAPVLKANGKQLGSMEEFDAAELDFRPQLLRLKKSGVKDLLLLATPRQIGHVFVQADQLKFKPQFYSFGVESDEIVRIAGTLAEGLLYAYSYDAASSTPSVRAFTEKYVQRFGKEPDAVAANTYDGIMLGASCLRQQSQAEQLKQCLYKVRGYDGASGRFSFDERGDAVKPLYLKTIDRGKFVRLAGEELLKKNQTTPVIAALLPLSGSGADQGEWCRRGFELALENLRAQGREDFEFRIEDSRGDARGALDAFNNLSSRYDLFAVLTWGSNVGVALAPVTNQQRLIQIGVATATPSYRTPGDHTFRVFHSGVAEGIFLAERVVASGLGARTALLKINHDYGIGIGEAFSKSLSERGGHIVFEDTFDPGGADFRTQLTRLRANRPEIIVLVSLPAEGAVVLRQLKELHIKDPVIAAGAVYGGRNFFDLVGDLAEGVQLVLPKPSNSSAARDFRHAYVARYGSDPGAINHYSARSYDAMNLLAAALKYCGGADTSCARDYLFQVRDYPGASSSISFDDCGDINYELAVFRIVNKEFELVQ